ncbi:TetR/AcrR family transcriptional regulator [Edaphobacter aggregans]|uniref:TetR/AcrR family transcriptional regulator n=1 Tax=Edaphobacter aggregans TaxID=570835 RepID=UPI00054D627F|nr:TetR/AcrR family transcriptional regulator [Edaphobacter aggregans]
MAGKIVSVISEKKEQPGRRGGRKSRRTEIVAAAAGLLRERGLQGVTTRAIAERVPCSEGAIYVHFEDRLELILAVLEESLPEMLVPLHALREKVGRGTVEKNLTVAVEGLVRFQERVVGMLCSLVTEAELRARFRERLGTQGHGPERGIRTLANYISEEQGLGRISGEVDAKVAARMLMAGAFFHVFTEELLGHGERLDAREMVRGAVRR